MLFRSSENHHRFFRTLAESGGARFVDVTKFFAPLSSAERTQCFFPFDGHYTSKGHEVIAAGMAEALMNAGVAAA